MNKETSEKYFNLMEKQKKNLKIANYIARRSEKQLCQ